MLYESIKKRWTIITFMQTDFTLKKLDLPPHEWFGSQQDFCIYILWTQLFDVIIQGHKFQLRNYNSIS